MIYALFVVGLILLLVGAEIMVSSSSRIAKAFGVSPIIIGITIVAFATSAPEIAVSVDAALQGQSTIAVGNVIGSNIANILLIMGLSALLTPLIISNRVIWLEVPIMIGCTLLVFALSLDGVISPIDGIIFLVAFMGFLWYQINSARKEYRNTTVIPDDENQTIKKPLWLQYILFIVGLSVLVYGAHLLVENAVIIARIWGVSEIVIGLTIIAIGTSLPEVATSVLAAWKGEQDLSVGNVIGSNIFNLLLVLGISSVILKDGIPVPESTLVLDFPFLIAVSVACMPIFFVGHRLGRPEGVVFLAYYLAYLIYLFFESTGHSLFDEFQFMMYYFIIPITVFTIFVFAIRHWWYRRNGLKTE